MVATDLFAWNSIHYLLWLITILEVIKLCDTKSQKDSKAILRDMEF